MTSLASYPLDDSVKLAPADRRSEAQPRYRAAICATILFAADGLAIGAALSCAGLAARLLGLQNGLGGLTSAPDLVVLSAAAIAYLAVHGRHCRRIAFWNEARLIVCAGLWAIALEAGLGLLAGDLAARAPTFAGLLILPIAGTAFNLLAKQALQRIGLWRMPIVVIGNGECATEAEAALTSDRSLGYSLVARVEPATALSGNETTQLQPLMRRHGASLLLVALDDDSDLQRRVVECALRERVAFALVPRTRDLPAFAFDASRCFGQNAMLLSFQNGLSRPVSRVVKATIDVSVAAIMLVLSSPLFLLLAILSQFDGGSMLFAHRRVGAGGRSFLA